jgi:hypothetical protein
MDPEKWGPDGSITLRDANGLTLPVKLGIGRGLSAHPCPTGYIDAVGILDQEAPGYPPSIDNRAGYRLLVPDYDGNGLVLTSRPGERSNLPSDVNGDAGVNMADFAALASDWLKCVDGLCGCDL